MLSCRDSSDGEGGDDSGTDDDADEDEEEKKKWVPEWAKGPLLKEALERVSDSLSLPAVLTLFFFLISSSLSKPIHSPFLLSTSHFHLHSSHLTPSPLLRINYSPTHPSIPPPACLPSSLPLSQQYGLNGHTAMDPDSIFHEVQTCSLEEIFGVKEGKSGV